jgi:N-methylhydantoinase B
MPDMAFLAPVFAAAGPFGFAEAWGHLGDIGGMMPGSISPDATETFQEGILVPPTRIYQAGVLNSEVLRMFLRNSRFPDMVKGDLNAIMACCQLGKKRLEAIAERFGAEIVDAAFELMLEQTGAALRQALDNKLPDGRFRFRDYLDSDAVSDQSYAVDLALEKRNGRVTLDFSDSDDQAKGAVNFIMDASVPAYMAGLYLTGDEPGIEMNAGFERAIDEVITRPGSLLNPHYPAPVGMRSHTMIRVNAALLGALAQATGGQASAASSVYVLYYLRSYDYKRGDYELCIEGLAVGFGARTFADGIDAVYYVAQKNYPVEFAEMEFGVRIEGYRMHIDSGGPGRYRGGCGIVRDVRVIGDEAVLGLRLDNVKYPPWGVNGGPGGRPGRVLVTPGAPEERELNPMSDRNQLKKGDLVRIMTAGGGGWGSPLQRPAQQVRLDVLDGFISRESAHADYGVVLSSELELDTPATQELRAKLSQQQAAEVKMFHRGSYYDA